MASCPNFGEWLGGQPVRMEGEGLGDGAVLTLPASGSQMTFQEICKDVHMVKNQGQQVFIESRVKPVSVKPFRPGKKHANHPPLPPPPCSPLFFPLLHIHPFCSSSSSSPPSLHTHKPMSHCSAFIRVIFAPNLLGIPSCVSSTCLEVWETQDEGGSSSSLPSLSSSGSTHRSRRAIQGGVERGGEEDGQGSHLRGLRAEGAFQLLLPADQLPGRHHPVRLWPNGQRSQFGREDLLSTFGDLPQIPPSTPA